MKKLSVALLVVALGCFTTAADAQVRLGIKGGVNFNNFSTSDALTFDNATSWQVGLMARFKLPIIQLGVQPELLYTVKNTKIGDEDADAGYLQVPLNAIWTFQLGKLGPFIMAGPYFSYALDFSGPMEDYVERFDWGLGVGAGVDIGKFELGLRYDWGMQDVSKIDSETLKNNTFTIFAGFFF